MRGHARTILAGGCRERLRRGFLVPFDRLGLAHRQRVGPDQRGERIAQMVVAPVTQVHWEEAASLNDTQRGAGGFGSTGT